MGTPLPLRVLEGHARAYRHTWRGTTISAVVSPVLFLAAMGLGLGTLVDDGGTALAGVGYLAWLAPGLLVGGAFQNGAADGSFPVIAGIRWLETYEAALHSPVRPRDLLLGNLSWAAIRALVAAGCFVVVAAAFGAMPFTRGLLALGPALLTAVGTCAWVAVLTARRPTDQALSSTFRFLVMPLFLFSGTFFPVDQLPEVVRPVALVVPLWHGVELARSLVLGTPSVLAWPLHLAVLAATALVGSVVAVAAFDRRLRQ
jgi:lipooligosaccharide transport system permease protein